jgi:hypothetical protein
MPHPTEENRNPIFKAGAIHTEQELDYQLLDELKRTRPKKPFFK